MKRGYSRASLTQPLVAEQSVIGRIDRRGRTQSNLWIFESPKNARRFTIAGDLNFMLCVLLEGDTSVAGYNVEPGPYHVALDGTSTVITPDIEIERHTGSKEWWEVTRSPEKRSTQSKPPSILARACEVAGPLYGQRTERDIEGKAVAFDNWLLLCAAMTRARHFAAHHEAALLRRCLGEAGAISVRDLLNTSSIDRALMIATIGHFLQKGRVTADLERRLFSEDTLLTERLS